MKKLLLLGFLEISILYAQSNSLIPFSIKNKIGFINNKLEIVVEPTYDSLNSNKENTFVLYNKQKNVYVLLSEKEQKNVHDVILLGDGYYSMYYDPDTFVYDNTGKRIRILSQLQHDHQSTYDNMIVFDGKSENIIKQDNTYVFNDTGIIEIFNYDPFFKIALCRYRDKGYSLVSESGVKNTDPFQFGMRSMSEGFVFGKNLKTGECGFYNMDCKLVIKAGTKNGSTMDDWNCYPGINCGVVALVNDGEKNVLLSEWQTLHSDNWCIVDSTGHFLEYGITADKIYPFSDDVAVLMIQNGKNTIYRLIGKNGKIITDRDFDQISSSVNGYCMAVKDGVDYLIKSKDGSVYRCSDFK